jgi:hypothetical protein
LLRKAFEQGPLGKSKGSGKNHLHLAVTRARFELKTSSLEVTRDVFGAPFFLDGVLAH